MSSAMNRYYDLFDGKQPNDCELFTQFKYSDLEGFDYNNFDGTISRCAPSRIIFHNGKFFICGYLHYRIGKRLHYTNTTQKGEVLPT